MEPGPRAEVPARAEVWDLAGEENSKDANQEKVRDPVVALEEAKIKTLARDRAAVPEVKETGKNNLSNSNQGE